MPLDIATPLAELEPIRAELFSVERLEQHAESLAAAQRVSEKAHAARPLAPRLDANTKVLTAAYRAIVNANRAHQSITPAAEWLLDNFHVVEEQIREIKNDLPPGFYKMLPKLAEGPLAGYPRVFGVAWALVAHTDSAFDVLKLTRLVVAYQRVQPLTIGELWAIAITLRITLVENLRRLAEAMVVRLDARRQADALADRTLGTEKVSAESTAAILHSLDQIPWSVAFAVQLAQRLRDRDPNITPALQWLNERLAAEGTTTDEIVRDEVQRQSATNVTVRNVITSMRLISTIHWAEWFESVSLVDETLRAESDFAAMDFPTRDLYRRAIEDLARNSEHTEIEVARQAIAAAKQSREAAVQGNASSGRESDPGYYLISEGRRGLEMRLGSRVRLRKRLFRAYARCGIYGYIGAIALVSAAVLGFGLVGPALAGLCGWTIAILVVLGAIPASDVAVALINRVITQNVDAALLPGLELRDGVPAHLSTFVVMPTLLTSQATIDEQIERLEIHYLSNADDNLHFALLSDWMDSLEETSATDDKLLSVAVEGIARLNRKHGPTNGSDRFYLLHRRRVWNAGEGEWIGWERKRGKLHELNRLLRGASDTTFLNVGSKVAALPKAIRYVITLDADTRMPIGVAKRLIGKMAHPLSRPRVDPRLGRVTEGHGILQPRVTPSLPLGRGGSLFQRAFSGPNGLDPYAFAVSDVYQDLFQEGSYVGKGIYDVDVVEQAMARRIPESTVLSHDLLEGIFTRAGLVSDIEVVEEFPSRYGVAAARQHRWTRGDWQLLPWIFGSGPGARDHSGRSAIPAIGRWKLLDNLRRSLSAPATLLAFIVGWVLPFQVAVTWTTFLLFTIVFPPLVPLIAGIVPRRRGVSTRNHLRGLGDDLALGLLQGAFLVIFLAHQAWLMVDAVTRTLYRQFFVRRRLLEWTTAAQSGETEQFDTRALWVQISASAAFAGAIGIVITIAGHHTWPIVVPFAALWVFSPLVARLASRPPPAAGHLALTASDAHMLRSVARRTWRFFETFVTAEDNMLPPDNFQEDPHPLVAHRTSPTNIGLYLLSIVAARDFGWLGTLEMVDRLEATHAAMGRLERSRGHFYNWYDTRDLHALEPKYISSVDSGNLGGHLIALSNACGEIASGQVLNPRWVEGLKDTLNLIVESIGTNPTETRPQELKSAIEEFEGLLEHPRRNAVAVAQLLDELVRRSDAIAEIARDAAKGQNEEILIWSDALRVSVQAHQRDFTTLMPWAGTFANSEVLLAGGVDFSSSAEMLTFEFLPELCEAALRRLKDRKSAASGGDQQSTALICALEKSAAATRSVCHRLRTLAEALKAMANAMEFGFLFDPNRQLLSIGYRGADGALDSNYYDLLASESRLASFFAIAKGDIPARHWFRLGRTLTPIDGASALISWSGSMFEYLMPSLVMRAPAGSLLEQTNRLIVRRQIEYGDELGTPWGMSESEFNARDIEQTYQYSAFGVPDLGYKRALGESTVIAPYATALAAMVDPAAAVRNFERLVTLGARGQYGWYEAVDYTRSRLPDGAKFAIVRAYMAHHQAMSVVALANTLLDGTMRARFHAEATVQAAELLLQERMPRDVALARPPEHATETIEFETAGPEVQRRYVNAHSRVPRTQLLSNGRYSVMVTAAGSGYSRWHDIAVTRWREDTTCDGWGSYIYLRDVNSGDVWSAGYQPSGVEPDTYEVVFSEDRAQIVRRDGSVDTMLEIVVSPEDDAEVRRVSITNHGAGARQIELTTYAEIALARQPDDVAHPAFAKLFVETEFVSGLGAILATRRRRSDGDPQVWSAHLVVVEGEASGDVQFETDRARFLGRGRNYRAPAAIHDGWPLSNTVGPVLDPVFSQRRRVRIPAGTTARVAFWTMAAPTRDAVLDLADKHHDAMAFERASTLAWTQAQMQLHHLGISTSDAHLFQRLANHVLYSDPALRPAPDVLKRGAGRVSTLWAQGISGDLPIVLVQVVENDDLDFVRHILRAHEYWRLKRLAVDLVILNEQPSSYAQDLQNSLDGLVRMNRSMPRASDDAARGEVFILRADLISMEVRGLLQTAARAVLRGSRGSLAEQVDRAREFKPPAAPPPWPATAITTSAPPLPRPALEFFNGLGGFGAEGREYVTTLDRTNRTPAPWINVIANPSFGFQVSTEGSGYTWALNSQQNQLTPWSNDPVGDAPGEALYVRDEETGDVWGPTALPIREEDSPYTATHGQGYSRFEHGSHGVALELRQYVPVDDSIKISRLKITNLSTRIRRLSITAYVEWVLGATRTTTAPFIVTEIDPQTQAMFAQNPWNNDFGEQVAFADLAGQQTAWTGDRAEFVGREGTLDRPLGLTRGAQLSNRVGAGLDPCGALQTRVTLGADRAVEVVFFLGAAANRAEAQSLIAKYRIVDLDVIFAVITKQWDDITDAVQVKTPDRALDILVNRWLPYQTLACRVWARTGFYQASGAYGFRDQLQDVMALCISRPDLTRAHLLRAAARQFPEGDVQHWWLPESDRGIRTRVADDRIWLSYVAAHYVEVTGDLAVLDEMVPFLDGPVLREGERDAFFQPTVSMQRASLFEHCALALDRSLATGVHGLPLMGTGDWNDGMDRVGDGGKGESIWLGWFLYSTLVTFGRLADWRGESVRAYDWLAHSVGLKAALEQQAWDGDWYRRAYFDDGTPLGSVSNSECRIDSIAQSWSVISGAAEPARAQRAMAAVDKYLIQRDDRLVLLFTPPFDRAMPDPGYIKGYPAGMRENGGQYTHAAVWSAFAFAKLGDGDRAFELLALLNPINHANSHTGIHRYKVEPYVVSADVYSMPPHVGRGGWTWYTGSAGWFYRIALERVLGFRLQGRNLFIDPCIPKVWPGYEISFRYGGAHYDIGVENPLGVCCGILAMKLDGRMLSVKPALIPLVDDGASHQVQVVLG